MSTVADAIYDAAQLMRRIDDNWPAKVLPNAKRDAIDFGHEV